MFISIKAISSFMLCSFGISTEASAPAVLSFKLFNIHSNEIKHLYNNYYKNYYSTIKLVICLSVMDVRHGFYRDPTI